MDSGTFNSEERRPGKLRLKSKKICLRNEETGKEDEVKELHPLVDLDHVLKLVFTYIDKGSCPAASLVCKSWHGALRKVMANGKNKPTFYFTEKQASEFIQTSDDELSDLSIIHFMRSAPISLKITLECPPPLPCPHSRSRPNALSRQLADDLIDKLQDLNIVVECLDLEACKDDLVHGWKTVSSLNDQIQELKFNSRCSCNHCERSCSPNLRYLVRQDVHELEELELPHQPNNLPTARPPLNNRGNFVVGRPRNDPFKDVTFTKLRSLKGSFRLSCVSTVTLVAVLFKKFLKSSPMLEELKCILPQHGTELFNALREGPGTLDNLKRLSNVILNEDELRTLLNKKLKLEELSMELYAGFRVSSYFELLSNAGSSLETLEINYNNFARNPEEFPCAIDLVKLKNLTMSKFYGSIQFVSVMPSLKSLTLKEMDLSVALHNDDPNKQGVKSEVKKLQIFSSRGTTGRFLLPAVFNDMVSLFPELTHLRMEFFTDSSLRLVIQELVHLEELDIPNGIYSDQILGRDDSADECTSGSEDDKPKFLTDLKKLRKVCLQSPKITDRGVRFGLMKCKELRAVHIDSPAITDTSLNQLCQNDDILHLEFTNCYQLTPSAIADALQFWGKGRNLIIKNT